MSKKQLHLSIKRIREMQKEMAFFNITEEYTDYKLNAEYLDLFLQRYSDLDGEYGYIQGAILTSLFDFIKKKKPNISEADLVIKSQRFYPIIRAMLYQGKVFKLIGKLKKGEKIE